MDTNQAWRLRTNQGEAGEFTILGDRRLWYQRAFPGIQTLQEIPAIQSGGRVTGRSRQLQRWDEIGQYRITASSDGKRVAALRRIQNFDLFFARLKDDGKRVEEVRKLKVSGLGNALHAWTPDGKGILYESAWDGSYRIFEQPLDKLDTQVMRVTEPGTYAGRFSPDGKWLLYISPGTTGAVRKLMRVLAAGSPPQVLLDDPAMRNYYCTVLPVNFCVASFEVGNQLVFRRFDPGLDPPPGGFPVSQLEEVARSDYHPTDWGVSPDGSRIAMVRPDPQDARIHIIPLRTSRGAAPPYDVIVKGWTSLNTLNWALGGKGWYVSDRMMTNGITRAPCSFAYIDLAGNPTVLDTPDSFFPSWGVPSPDGRYLAFASAPGAVSVWLMEGFE